MNHVDARLTGASPVPCDCSAAHSRRRVVLTGGPGAGKTAVLELVRRTFCEHLVVVPEAAGVIFGGGFPRHPQDTCARAEQRAIYYVQRELETCADAHNPAVVLCDRGTLDGMAYWPAGSQSFLGSLTTTLEREMSRYDTVIHLRSPSARQGYNRQNPLRTESPELAADIDERILQAWSTHPRRFVVDPSTSFLDKATRALELLRAELPTCCSGHVTSAEARL